MKFVTSLLIAGSFVACTGDKPCDPNAPNTICTIAGHTLDEGYAGDNKPAIDADLFIPMDSSIAPDGTLWFIDFNNYVVRQIDGTGAIHTVIGNHQLGDSPASEGLPSIAARDAANNHTPSMTFHDGYLYLPAWHESRVKRVRLSDMMMEIVAGRGVRTYYDGDGKPAMTAGVDLPASITFDPQGNLVFMDQGNLVVRMIDVDGLVHTIAGQCVIPSGAGPARGPGDGACPSPQAPVQCPNSDKLVCAEASDVTSGVYASWCNSPAGPSTAQCMQVTTGDNGLATEAQLNLPYTQFADPTGRLTYDHAGNLIIPEAGGNRIRRIDHATGIITTIAGTGIAGYGGDGGPATAASINHPVDIAIADDNTIYFTDVNNHCIRKIDPAGTITRVVGVCNYGGDPDFTGDGGPPLEAHLNKPYGIDLVGNRLYISDSYNNRLRVANLPSP